jgi:hypothetical protein
VAQAGRGLYRRLLQDNAGAYPANPGSFSFETTAVAPLIFPEIQTGFLNYLKRIISGKIYMVNHG